MRPLVSDTRGIIVKSIILDHCQNSNWGFHKESVEIKENAVTTLIEDGPFTYTVLGKTTSGFIFTSSYR